RAMIVSDGPVLEIEAGLLTPRSAVRGDGAAPSRVAASATVAAEPETSGLTLGELQRRQIEEALERCGWVIEGGAGAAATLGLHPNTLRSRLKKLGITRRR